MSLELYILPPLFSLPSISGSCIAALSLCNLSLDKNAVIVVESIDLSIGLPALKDGDSWYRGYSSIRSYLAKRNDVDASLSTALKADVVAWGSLVEDVGDMLTWNSLFVSRQNYLGVTRREISLSLPFPYGFLLPTALRAYALRRCHEIGMIEDLEDEQHKATIKDGFSDTWLSRRILWDEKGRALRLHAMASEFYHPLSDLVISTTLNRPFMFGNATPTSLDALIYGHLSLQFFPTLPDPILKTTIVESHPRLAFYLYKCHEFFEESNNATIKRNEGVGWKGILKGWGVEQGKRAEDFIGIGGLTGAILVYALWKMVRG